MAKDILSRYIKFEVDDSGGNLRDLSGDLVPGSLSGPGFKSPEVRMTGSSDVVENILTDIKASDIAAQFYMNDTATTGAWTVLKGIQGGAEGTLTISFGTGAAATTGDPKYTGEHVCLEASIGINGGAVVINAVFKPGPTADAQWTTV